MIDHYSEAVRIWQQANKNLKHFAECCAMVEGHRTLSLAQDCKVSVDTIESYRNAYILFQQLQVNMETSEPARIWDEANLSLWVKAAQLKKRLNLTLNKTFEYLQIASDEDMTREQLSAHVDEKENHTPKWLRRIQHAIKILFPSKDDWKTEMPIDKRERYEQATARYVHELQEIAEGEEAIQ